MGVELPGKGGSPGFRPGQKDPEFAEKNFGRLLIFFRLLFLLNLPVPNETPAAKFRLTRKPRVWFSVFGKATLQKLV